MELTQLNPGDVVKIKGQPVAMTVGEIDEVDGVVKLWWFDTSCHLQFDAVPPDILELVGEIEPAFAKLGCGESCEKTQELLVKSQIAFAAVREHLEAKGGK